MRSSYLEYFNKNKVSKPSVGYLLLVTIIAQLRDNTPLINFFLLTMIDSAIKTEEVPMY